MPRHRIRWRGTAVSAAATATPPSGITRQAGPLRRAALLPSPPAALGFLLRREAPRDPEVAVDQDSARRITEEYVARSRDTLIDQMGIRILEATAQRVIGTMPVAGNTQPLGLLHGGASCVLAETLGSLGSALHAGPDRITVGVEISATHHHAAAAGQVTGIASLLHGGRTITTYEIVISDEQERRVCTSRLTCLLMDRVPGQGRPGRGG